MPTLTPISQEAPAARYEHSELSSRLGHIGTVSEVIVSGDIAALGGRQQGDEYVLDRYDETTGKARADALGGTGEWYEDIGDDELDGVESTQVFPDPLAETAVLPDGPVPQNMAAETGVLPSSTADTIVGYSKGTTTILPSHTLDFDLGKLKTSVAGVDETAAEALRRRRYDDPDTPLLTPEELGPGFVGRQEATVEVPDSPTQRVAAGPGLDRQGGTYPVAASAQPAFRRATTHEVNAPAGAMQPREGEPYSAEQQVRTRNDDRIVRRLKPADIAHIPADVVLAPADIVSFPASTAE